MRQLRRSVSPGQGSAGVSRSEYLLMAIAVRRNFRDGGQNRLWGRILCRDPGRHGRESSFHMRLTSARVGLRGRGVGACSRGLHTLFAHWTLATAATFTRPGYVQIPTYLDRYTEMTLQTCGLLHSNCKDGLILLCLRSYVYISCVVNYPFQIQ